jgi:hypothetical protein
MAEFKELTLALVALQILVVLLALARAFALKRVFSLNAVVSLALVLYVSVPILVCLPHDHVIVNGASIEVEPVALLMASIFGFLWSIVLWYLPQPDFKNVSSERWVVWLFLALFVVNLVNLVNFIRGFDLATALISLGSGAGAAYRDIAFQGLKDSDTGYGYVPKILHLAVFAVLWLGRTMPRPLLLMGASPVIILDVLSFGRHTLASFFVLLFFCLEQKGGVVRRIYWIAPCLVLLLFFSRVLIFSFTDVSYETWFQSSFDARSGGVEFIGEFFNTFGTYLMVASAPVNGFDGKEIASMLAGQALIPPGFGQHFYSVLDMDFPLFRISDMMHARYGPHPAHHAFVDLYSFGAFAAVGVVAYLIGVIWTARSHSSLARVAHLFLLGLFYLPFRGSLTLNALRLVWLLFGVWAFALVFRSIPLWRFKP